MDKNVESKTKEIQGIVKRGFSTKTALDFYKKNSFMAPEKILCMRFFSKHSKVLDLGCGAGRTSIALAKKGFKVTGIDLTKKMIETAKENAKENKAKIDFKEMDAMKLGFESNSFDCALFSYNGIEHIPFKENRVKALKEIHRVLKGKGTLIFSTSNRWGKGIIGRKIVFNMIKLLLFKLKHFLGLNLKKSEFGDTFYSNLTVGGIENFQHISSSFEAIEQLRKAGFTLTEFVPAKNVLNGKKPSFFSNFENGILYFVAVK